MAEAKITEKSVSYSIGVKANIGNYQSVDAHWSESEKWDVSGLTPDEADALREERLSAIRPRLEANALAFLEENGK